MQGRLDKKVMDILDQAYANRSPGKKDCGFCAFGQDHTAMQNALDAGLRIFSCLEPVGPEHTVEEIVENMFIGIDLGCTQHAVMRRVAVPGTPLARYGQISNLRLGQMVAVVALATFSMPTMTYMGVHEPTEIAYVSGANVVTAETGVNPRDHMAETSANRGLDMDICRFLRHDGRHGHLSRLDHGFDLSELGRFTGSSRLSIVIDLKNKNQGGDWEHTPTNKSVAGGTRKTFRASLLCRPKYGANVSRYVEYL